jgi:lipopolysaccharide transport system permease protein
VTMVKNIPAHRPQTGLPVVYSSDSPLIHPRRFLRHAARDLRYSADTAKRLFLRNLAQRYRYSSLGLFWAFAPSAIIAALLTVGQRARASILSNSHVAPQLYAIFGLILAQTFLEAFSTQRTLFSTNRYLLNRHRSAIEGLILAGVGDNLFSLIIKLPIVAVVFYVYKMPPADTVLLGVLTTVLILMLGTALGLFLAPLSALKMDVDNIMMFFPWLLFGLTPVFVEPSAGGALAKIYHWNPLTAVFNTARGYTYGSPEPHFVVLVGIAIAVGVLTPLAWMLCRVARPHVVERYLV